MSMNAHSHSRSERALHLSAKVCVAEVVSSRYGISADKATGVGVRPQSWDKRKAGFDVVRTESGATIKLSSSPMQSTPKPGWVIVLTGGSEQDGYSWTLYGIARSH